MALKAGRYGVTKEMLEYLNDPGGGGGGSCEIAEDDFIVSETESTGVHLGFTPDFLIVYSGKGSNYLQFVYNKEYSENKQVRSYIYGGYHGTALWNLPYSGTESNALVSIDDGGFTIFKIQTAVYTTDSKMHYIAIKKKDV